MDFLWSEEQEQIRDAVERACAPFDADYWLRKDHEGGFPHDFHKALALPCRRSSAARAWASARRR
jgi:acyl-CoA dehydrogenase